MKAFTQAMRTSRRSPYQSATAIVIVFTTFLLIFSISNLLQMGQAALKYFEIQPEITAFFKPEATNEQVQQVANELVSKDYVKEVTVVDKEAAFALYGEENADEPLLLELLSADLFPVSLSVSANEPEKLVQIRTDLQNVEGIDEIVFNDDVYEQFLTWTNILRQVGVGVCIVFGAQLMLVLIVIMSMMVSGKRESIKIMGIIGATKKTIKRPFVIQGIWFGWWGSLLAFLVSQAVLYLFAPQIQTFFGDIQVLPLPIDFVIIQGAVGIVLAMLLGAIAASIAAGRMARRR